MWLLYFAFPFILSLPIEKGQTAPDFTSTNTKGKEISLSDFKGDVILLDFWASWCKPCRLKNPEVVEIYKKYKKAKFRNGAKFQIISVSLDKDEKRWLDAIKEDGLNWNTHLSDLKGWKSSIAQLYGVKAIPTMFLINEKGVIVATGAELRGLDLHIQIDNLLE
jgi:peroxiredoxin